MKKIVVGISFLNSSFLCVCLLFAEACFLFLCFMPPKNSYLQREGGRREGWDE